MTGRRARPHSALLQVVFTRKHVYFQSGAGLLVNRLCFSYYGDRRVLMALTSILHYFLLRYVLLRLLQKFRLVFREMACLTIGVRSCCLHCICLSKFKKQTQPKFSF